jgi:hypothetical protein
MCVSVCLCVCVSVWLCSFVSECVCVSVWVWGATVDQTRSFACLVGGYSGRSLKGLGCSRGTGEDVHKM